jgi:hypothetical protein
MNLDKIVPLLKQERRLAPAESRSRIQKIGIELEGGWSKLPRGVSGVVHDGSVLFRAEDPVNYPAHIGELPSQPLDPKQAETWVRNHYPQFVNNTCGLHVHMSFRQPLLYMRLMEEDYTEAIVRFLSEWAKEERLPKDHPIWGRLAGKSEYCVKRFDAESQVRMTRKDYNRRNPGNRYTMVNYCYGLHSTLEVRVLPMFAGADQAWRSIKRVLDITNAYLILNGKREKPASIEITADEESFTEEVRSCV